MGRDALGIGQRQEIGRLRWWFPASVVAFTAGFVAVWSIGGSEGSSEYALHALPHVLDPAGTPGTAIVGLTVGVAQWLVLRRKRFRAVWWVPASVAGFVLGWLAAVAVPAHGPEAHLAGGAAFGGALLWILRHSSGAASSGKRGPAGTHPGRAMPAEDAMAR